MGKLLGRKPSFEGKMAEQVHAALKALRFNSGLTQDTLGDFLGVCRSTYTYYERGTTFPSAATLYRLSQFYDVSPDVFFVPGAVVNLHPDAQRVNGRLKSLEQKSPAQKAAEEKKGRKKPGREKEGRKKPGGEKGVREKAGEKIK